MFQIITYPLTKAEKAKLNQITRRKRKGWRKTKTKYGENFINIKEKGLIRIGDFFVQVIKSNNLEALKSLSKH